MKRAALTCVLGGTLAFAQNAGPDVDAYLRRIGRGETDVVRAELPSLLDKYPNNPGVLYLQAVLTTDGTEAIRIYQSIVDNFPQSEWADDALYKVYQFYYAIGLYRTAEIKMHQLATDYPQSKYITQAVPQGPGGLPEEKDTVELARQDSGRVVEGDSLEAATASPSVPARDVPPVSPAPSARGQYALQMGAYSLQTNAEKQKLFFEDLGYPVEVINKVRDNKSLFVVLVGEFKTADEARAKGDEIREKYDMHPMVVTR